MFRNRKLLRGAGVGLALLLATPALSGSGSVRAPWFSNTEPPGRSASTADSSVALAATEFVHAIVQRDIGTVWMFATEEEQDAFATEGEAYHAYAEAYPELTRPGALTLEREWSEGDTPFVEFQLASRGEAYRVTIGLWRDDANDWKVVSCEVTALSDRVAGL